MNAVTQIFTDLTDQEIIQAIQELKEDGPQGIYRSEGIVRQTCKKVGEVVGESPTSHLTMVHFAILQEAAYRFTPKL